jgi:glycogen operon protein
MATPSRRAIFEVHRGSPYPFGATLQRGGVNFSVFARHATTLKLVLYRPGHEKPIAELPLDPHVNRTGDVWHIRVDGLPASVEYGYRADRAPNSNPRVHRYEPEAVLVDPYARVLTAHLFPAGSPRFDDATLMSRRTWRSAISDDEFDWGLDQPLNRHLADTIIFEIHVRGFTIHPSARVSHPGTFRAVAEKIPYLKELGVTAVELMPVTEFDEFCVPHVNPFTGERLRDYWGYNPVSFFAPKASYGGTGKAGGEIAEFKAMVKALHAAGIEVILDIVLNHTGEGDERGRTISWRGLDNSIYYIIDPVSGRYHNYSGCGNTFNCNHPVVRSMLVACLRYWVTEMHVDGFRFDLASVLGRGQDGEVMFNPPLLERIAAEPVLANTKLIAEAWDAAGLYQVGTFPNWGRWAEWNGRFRDDVRRFLRGDSGTVGALATRLAGSADLYQDDGRAPYHGINFITSHDGFTLADLCAYDAKHNEANGDNGAGGSNDNFSWNCGVEGPTEDPAVNALRRRQMRNAAAILLVSQGVPMILGGDERGRTQFGNNNAYCQDNELSWLDWGDDADSRTLRRFFRLLIDFRKRHPNVRRRSFAEGAEGGWPAIWWHGTKLNQADWSQESRHLGMHLPGGGNDDDVYVIVNGDAAAREFDLPPLSRGRRWRRVVDTMLLPPNDIAGPRDEPIVRASTYPAGPRSVVILVGR